MINSIIHLNNNKHLNQSILDKNFRCKIGEIDIIAREGNYICFIEVKTRYGDLFGSPCEAVTYSKQQRISKVAQIYIMKKRLYRFFCRFDVIEVILNKNDDSENGLIESLKDDYIVRAKAVSYIIDAKPQVEYDVEELQKIADLILVDEIHLFDKNVFGAQGYRVAAVSLVGIGFFGRGHAEAHNYAA